MKNHLFVLTVVVIILFSSCSGKETSEAKNKEVVVSPLTVTAPLQTTPQDVVRTTAIKAQKPNVSVDLDLTAMSSTMVYSQVNDMLTNPTKYIGKTVRAKGDFVVAVNADHTVFYPTVLMTDATACCAQGLEFILKDEPSYPKGYPAPNATITVSGVFQTYLEDDSLYCHLVDAVLE